MTTDKEKRALAEAAKLVSQAIRVLEDAGFLGISSKIKPASRQLDSYLNN